MKQEKTERRKSALSLRRFSYLLILLLVVLFALVALRLSFGRKDELAGRWALDSNSVYAFDGRGAGSLTLPSGSYDYRYIDRDSYLSIDFADPDASDVIYRYTVSDGILTLDQDIALYTLSRLPD